VEHDRAFRVEDALAIPRLAGLARPGAGGGLGL